MTTKTRAKENGKAAATKATPRNRLPKKPQETIAIKQLQLQVFDLHVIGKTPLCQHKFSEKAAKAIETKQQGKAKTKDARQPKDEYLASFYMIKGEPEKRGCVYGIPVAAFKNAMVGACRYVDGLTMTLAKGAFFIHGTDVPDMATIITKKGPRMQTDAIRLSGPGSNLDLRYRPYFDDWSCVLKVEIDRSNITPEQVVNLANRAGFHIGVQEWRPEKGGVLGQFEVDLDKLKFDLT